MDLLPCYKDLPATLCGPAFQPVYTAISTNNGGPQPNALACDELACDGRLPHPYWLDRHGNRDCTRAGPGPPECWS